MRIRMQLLLMKDLQKPRKSVLSNIWVRHVVVFCDGFELTKVECSAVQNRGIRETFYEAAKVALEVKPANGSSSGGCIIL